MKDFGRILEGSSRTLSESYQRFQALPVDMDLRSQAPAPAHPYQQTIAQPAEVSAPGTFSGKETRRLRLLPCNEEGWWFNRTDQPDSLPVRVSIRNVWTTGDVVSNIVLRSGSPHNYIRLVEHMIALRTGTDIDNLTISLESGDPPLFDRGSLDLVEAIENAGRTRSARAARHVTLREPAAYVRGDGSFLLFQPADPGRPALDVDCAVDFPNAIGVQRIRFPLNAENFRFGAEARTNTTSRTRLFCQTIGKLFADVRNLGYTERNVLVAGRKRYVNQPRLLHEGKSLEAVWHRAVLDLLAAIALIDDGRFLGKITSYKAGHFMDVEMIRLLYAQNLFTSYSLPSS